MRNPLAQIYFDLLPAQKGKTKIKIMNRERERFNRIRHPCLKNLETLSNKTKYFRLRLS